MTTIDELLKSVSEIIENHDKEAKETGCDFNVFKVIRQERKELLHSNFIAELLDPRGSHRQGDKFLKSFCEEIGINEIDFASAVINREKYIGRKTESEDPYGFIDIYIYDKNGKEVAIENKIDAGDQDNQIKRYYNFTNKQVVFYLTLFGTHPKDTENLKLGKEYKIISYSTDILSWLKKCLVDLKRSAIFTQIEQYTNIIRQMTNQTNMNIDISKKLNDAESLFTASKIAKSLPVKVDDLKKLLLKDIYEKLNYKLENKCKLEDKNKGLKDSIDAESLIKYEIKTNHHFVCGIGKKGDLFSLFTVDNNDKDLRDNLIERLLGTKSLKTNYNIHKTHPLNVIAIYGNQQDLDFKELNIHACSIVSQKEREEVADKFVEEAINAIEAFVKIL